MVLTSPRRPALNEEELRKKDAGQAIVNPDGTTWKPKEHDYEKLKTKMEEAIRKGEKPPSNYGSVWDGNSEHSNLLKRIKSGEDEEGRKMVPLAEFYQQSGYPKRPMLGAQMDRQALLSEVDIDGSGLIYEMVIDNWSWDSLIIGKWGTSQRNLVEKMAPEAKILTLEEAIDQFFPTA